MMESGKEKDVKFGNELGFIILPFHIGLHDDPLQYVRKAKKIVDRKKCSLEVVFTHLAAEVILKIFGLKVRKCVILILIFIFAEHWLYMRPFLGNSFVKVKHWLAKSQFRIQDN
jgi:Kef-type K+ transport system membrane component KefB